MTIQFQYFLSYAFMFFQCFMAGHAMTVRNLTTDEQILLAFKHQIIDPHHILTNNWSTNYSVCNWVGVSCAAKHGRVSALDVSNMDLTGTIPPQFGNLSFLIYLNMSHNNFYGHLPRELEQLSRMKLIDLSSNFLNGEIPLWFGRLDKVVHLILQYNNFTGVIPPSIANMSNLEDLELRNNLLHGNIPHELSKLLNLRILSLGHNQLSGSIPPVIYNISSLHRIYLSFNNLSGGLPEDICRHFSNLEVLRLYENEFSGQIPVRIGECKNLRELFLYNNRFNGSIPRSIGNLTRLGYVDFSENNLDGKLPDMSGLSNIDVLFLWSNHLSGNIPDSISNVSKLTWLDLSENSFSGLIPNAIGNLKFLERLYLGSNYLTAKTPIHDECNFFCSLSNCKYLSQLILSFNPLTCILPTSLSNLPKSLQSLQVGECKIRGSIPMEIGSLNNTYYLDLSNNELSGYIPSTIGSLKNLQFLDVSRNKLQGSIPDEVCGLKGLYHLSLATNELHGKIPSCLGELTSLRYLYLSSNKLHSTIPLSFWSLKDILEVDLSSNYFNASLPLDIGNLKVITHLGLSRNFFSGDIPPTFGSLHDLEVLLLSHNRLQGPIPESFGDMMSLIELDLSDNNLSGIIPKSLEILSYLKAFDVSSNRLEGEIPNRGRFINFTAKSFMKNYALCGSQRLKLPPCKNRQSNKAHLRALKYALPIFGAVILVAAFIILYIKWQNKRTSLSIVEDLVPVREWRRISYHQLWEGSDGFNESNLLGSGSFGSVYKGIVLDGIDVAIKVFNLEMDGAFTSFEVECEVLGKILHRNLVKIITCCSSTDFKALVLEFMPNGSLEKCLYSDNHALDILQRINIMIDVASALEYLHSGFLIPVIHCDLKPSNVLLDEDMVAHVGDFGIAKLLGEGDSMKQTITLATIGYMAPEYGSAGIISVKSDVYSYGILLMETFTGKKPTDEVFGGEMSLKHWVKMSLSNGIIGAGDSSLVQEEDEYFVVKANCISSIMELALECSAELPEDRMDMKIVVSKLNNIKGNLLNNVGED